VGEHVDNDHLSTAVVNHIDVMGTMAVLSPHGQQETHRQCTAVISSLTCGDRQLSPGIRFPYYDGRIERTSSVLHPGGADAVYNFAEPVSAKHAADRLRQPQLAPAQPDKTFFSLGGCHEVPGRAHRVR
jgi:hypothetical protein